MKLKIIVRNNQDEIIDSIEFFGRPEQIEADLVFYKEKRFKNVRKDLKGEE